MQTQSTLVKNPITGHSVRIDDDGIQVAVFGTDSNGQPSVVIVVVEATVPEIKEGIHYEKAEVIANEHGYESIGLFADETEALFKVLNTDAIETIYLE